MVILRGLLTPLALVGLGARGWLQWFGGCALKLSFMFIASIVG